MRKNTIAAIVVFLVAAGAVSAVAEEQAPFNLDDAYIEAVFDNYPVQTAVQMLRNRDIDPQVIITEAQKAGFNDREITSGLYRSDLSETRVILETMQSPMSTGSVLRSLEDQGIEPDSVLHLLVQNQADTPLILSTGEYMLNRGYTQIGLLSVMVDAGADRDTIFETMESFDIPIATVIQVYGDVLGEIEAFGHIYTRHSLPKPALISIGVDRIHFSPASKERVISPKTP